MLSVWMAMILQILVIRHPGRKKSWEELHLCDTATTAKEALPSDFIWIHMLSGLTEYRNAKLKKSEHKHHLM
ncbi:hypothetical protein [Glutamicibacter nicotianae]